MRSSFEEFAVADDDFSWVDRAGCGGEDFDHVDFFAAAGHTITADVVEVCRACTVRAECVRYAFTATPPILNSGYFAGMSPSERKRHTLQSALDYVTADTAAYFDTHPTPNATAVGVGGW